MEPAEVQEQPANASELDSAASSKDRENTEKSSLTGNKESSTLCIANAVKGNNSAIGMTDGINNIVKTLNCDNSQSEKGQQILQEANEQSTTEVKMKNVKNEQHEEKSDGVAEGKKDCKILDNENMKSTPSKAGNFPRRKRKSLVQEPGVQLEDASPKSKKKRTKNTSDRFCWRCHKQGVDAQCSACPRSWHRKCMGGMSPTPIQNWICGECAAILKAENAETRSTAMAQLSIDQLCILLRHVVEQMRNHSGSEPFWKPVELSEAPNYLDYVVRPMDLSLLESNVKAKLYGSTDAFMADAKWIQHNCIVFNTCGGVYTDTSKLTNAAKQIIKFARQEVSEIEACPDCYAHGRNIPRPQPSWFIEPCRRPHPLVWAKLKGFPFWPAKAMPRVNTQGYIDVRFFGEHDRAWVSPRDVYLYSEDPPAPHPRKRKVDMDECVREITRHCRKLELVFGQFTFAPPRVQYNPNDPNQIKLLLPHYDPTQANDLMSPLSAAPKKRMPTKKRMTLTRTKGLSDQKSESPNLESKSLTDPDTTVKHDPENTGVKKEIVRESNMPTDVRDPLILVSNVKSETDSLLKDKKRYGKETRAISQETNLGIMLNNSENKSVKDNVNLNTVKNDTIRSTGSTEQDKTVEKEKTASRLSVHMTKQIGVNQNIMEKSPNKETSQKNNNVTPDVVENATGVQKQSIKSLKNITKVYKPKTRMVDKVNAERALKSISANDQAQTINTENMIVKLMPLQSAEQLSDKTKGLNNNKTTSVTSTQYPKMQAQLVEPSLRSPTETVKSETTTDQSVALLLVVNSGVPESLKQSSSTTDKEQITDASPTTNQTPRETVPRKKESRARKSFPNKPRNFVQTSSHNSCNLSTNIIDPIAYIPTHQTEHSTGYQMPPPEAGPLSASLYNGAHDLARKMAQLMEEAYKEAAQESNESKSSENQQATVHFLRLQIERMRWQHQQQLAELKHNTDRILREMRTSLEAERLRAIEETRREAEQEKMRCIEETKRKQWCAKCGREALFYCCWNTAYCDYPCQQSHWPAHMRTCAQQPSFTTIVTSSAAAANQQQVMPRLMLNTQHGPSTYGGPRA